MLLRDGTRMTLTACAEPLCDRKSAALSAPLDVEEQIPPGSRALVHAADEADNLLASGADNDQQAWSAHHFGTDPAGRLGREGITRPELSGVLASR
jgi:hypothetical protein